MTSESVNQMLDYLELASKTNRAITNLDKPWDGIVQIDGPPRTHGYVTWAIHNCSDAELALIEKTVRDRGIHLERQLHRTGDQVYEELSFWGAIRIFAYGRKRLPVTGEFEEQLR